MEQGSSPGTWHGTYEWDSEEWMAEGLCRGIDPELFFPDRGESAQPAKDVCSRCSVTQECLDYSLRWNIKHGVWGGMAEKDRRKLRAARTAPHLQIRRSVS